MLSKSLHVAIHLTLKFEYMIEIQNFHEICGSKLEKESLKIIHVDLNNIK